MDPLVDFVLNRKPGYCQYFASGAVLLFRSVGIPARVVCGFMIREGVSDKKNAWIIRGRDAHAWCEYYDRRKKQWVQLETTPVGAMNEALGIEEPSFGSDLLDSWRIRASMFVGLLKDFDFSKWSSSFSFRKALYVPILIVVILTALFLYRRRTAFIQKLKDLLGRLSKGKISGEDYSVVSESYRRFAGQLEERGVRVKENETTSEILDRVAEKVPDNSLFYVHCAEFVGLYNSVRFRSTPEEKLVQSRSRLDEILAELQTTDYGEQ